MIRFFLLAFMLAGGPAAACSSSTACTVADGEYFLASPEVEGLKPAVVYIHGFGGSGTGVFKNSGMVNGFLDRGYILAAPDGLSRPGMNGGSWSFHPQLSNGRDEISFIESVRDDLIANHGADPERIYLTGFSIGGSMTAYLACAKPEAFNGYAPLGGNFWRPHPESCEGPVRMLHTHGWTDGTVPLEGRVLRGEGLDDANALIQGDIFHAMTIWRDANECDALKADRFVTEGDYLRRAWDRCAPGSALELAIFPGGHVIPRGWTTLITDWFEAL